TDRWIRATTYPGNVRWWIQYDRRACYYVYAGLVFVPLDREMVKTFGDDWMSNADSELVYELLFRPQEDPAILKKERIVLLRRLDHPVNVNIAFFRNILTDTVNERSNAALQDL